ncbi:MAG: hypothetical protein ACK4LQ_14045 [Pararhodobacter sp.]
MKTVKFALAGIAALLVSGCTYNASSTATGHIWEINPEDNTVDRNIGRSNHLSDLQAGIWVDPHGCDHWMIDDGIEGYMSARLDPYGNPVCSGIAPPTVAVGRFRRGT